MRNVFDQYSQPENRLTHALVSALAADPNLLRRFIRFATNGSAPPSWNLEVLEQRIPGEAELPTEEESERRGLPDAWIHDGKGWALIIESKISSRLETGQLERHMSMAKKCGVSDPNFLALVVKRPREPIPRSVKVKEWKEVYYWLRENGGSEWARRVADYTEILEEKLPLEGYLKEGTLTVFSGVRFDKNEPYNYRQAKRLLGLALGKLRDHRDLKRALGIDPQAEGRAAITGSGGTSVWNYLSLSSAKKAKSFDEYPHLTLAIQRHRLLAFTAVPNNVRPQFRAALLSSGKKGFLNLMRQVHTNLARCLGTVQGAVPWLELVQRHFPSRRGEPINDGRLQFDLRTAFKKPARWRGQVKYQPQWLETVYEMLVNKRSSNLQLAVGAIFPYERCPAVRSAKILDHVAGAWISCKPLIRTMLG